ncbi:MAG: hypothetical protein J6O49_02135 [Bacteroidaceae bacterium]|nr:hypothetical protein [Bacteroidaceae bacterium]
MSQKEKFVGEAPLDEEVKKQFHFILKPDSVDNKHLKKGCITGDKLADSFLQELVNDLAEEVIEAVKGKIVADRFGNSTLLTISQRLITDTINDIYNQLRDIKGEPPIGLYLTATPEFFIGEEGCDVHLKAISTQGIMEHVAFYVNDVMIEGSEAEDVYQIEADVHIDGTSTFRCEASIFGIDYSVKKIITHYTSFWLGAGSSYQDIMDTAHTIPIEQTIRGAFNVECGEGEHIIVIVGDTLKKGFIRADLNGFEIPFNVEKITKDGNDYWVYTSENVYHAGTYNIDING